MSYRIGYNVAVGKTTQQIAAWLRDLASRPRTSADAEDLNQLADRVEAKEWAPPKKAKR